MIAEASRRHGLSEEETRRTERETLKARARDALSREIGFIPNPAFREMDADGTWRDDLKRAEVSDHLPVVAPSGRAHMPAHLERMCEAPLLSHAEERDLFCRMNYLKYRANSVRSKLNPSRPSARRLAEVEQLLAVANQLRNRIVCSNTRLVVSIVKKFSDGMNPFDELLSEGMACLLKAVEKFDFDRGFRFSTYTTMAVRREIFRWMNRSHRERTRFTTGTHEVLDLQLGAELTVERTESALAQLDRDISRIWSQLDEREQFIVKARYGFLDLGIKPTFARLGLQLGVSKERVRQLEIRAMHKIRDLVDELQLMELGDSL